MFFSYRIKIFKAELNIYYKTVFKKDYKQSGIAVAYQLLVIHFLADGSTTDRDNK